MLAPAANLLTVQPEYFSCFFSIFSLLFFFFPFPFALSKWTNLVVTVNKCHYCCWCWCWCWCGTLTQLQLQQSFVLSVCVFSFLLLLLLLHCLIWHWARKAPVPNRKRPLLEILSSGGGGGGKPFTCHLHICHQQTLSFSLSFYLPVFVYAWKASQDCLFLHPLYFLIFFSFFASQLSTRCVSTFASQLPCGGWQCSAVLV